VAYLFSMTITAMCDDEDLGSAAVAGVASSAVGVDRPQAAATSAAAAHAAISGRRERRIDTPR
jgi:outer membrane lipoprotein SlyB